MMRLIRLRYFLFIIAITAFLSVCKGGSVNNSEQGMFSIKMPALTVSDFVGKTYTLNKDLKGQYILVYFIDALLETDLDSVEKAIRDFQDWSVIVIVVARDIDKVQAKRFSSALYFAHETYEKTLNLFRAPQHQSVFYLFSDKGRLLHKSLLGTRYETRQKRILNFFVKNKKFEILDFFPSRNNVRDIPWLRGIDHLLQPSEQYYLGAFFNAFCDSCQGGRILVLLREIMERYPSLWGCFVVFKDDMDERDIRNFRSQWKIDFPVISASQEMRSRWDFLISEYSEEELNDIVVAFDRQGTILGSFAPDEDFTAEIRAFILSMLDSEKMP